MFIRVKWDLEDKTVHYWLAEAYRKKVRYHFRDVADLGAHPISCKVEDLERDVRTAAALFPEHREVFSVCPITKRLVIDVGRRSMRIPAWIRLAKIFKESDEAREGLRRWEDRIVDAFEIRDEYHEALRDAWLDCRAGIQGIPRPWRDGADHLWMNRGVPEWLFANDDSLAVLGLPAGATLSDVKAAYRRKAIENHPDRGGSVEAMARINAAYEKASRRYAHA